MTKFILSLIKHVNFLLLAQLHPFLRSALDVLLKHSGRGVKVFVIFLLFNWRRICIGAIPTKWIVLRQREGVGNSLLLLLLLCVLLRLLLLPFPLNFLLKLFRLLFRLIFLTHRCSLPSPSVADCAISLQSSPFPKQSKLGSASCFRAAPPI